VAEIYIKFIEFINLPKKMIELILLTSIATTPLPVSNSVTAPVLPSVTSPPPKPTFTPAPVPSPVESWAEKMWRRYKGGIK
jgi:hypothetical protein